MPRQILDPSEEVIIASINFEDKFINISYLEKREQTQAAGLMRNIYINADEADCEDLLEAIQALGRELVDAGLLAIRRPEASFDPRKRLKNRTRLPEDGDDE